MSRHRPKTGGTRVMKKILISTLGCAALAIGSIGCGGDDPANVDFLYGSGQPGLGKPEGGELRFERVKTPGGPITLVQSYFIESAMGDFPLPELGKCNR